MKIFVSICSYRDPLLQSTLESLVQTASGRHEITYGIFEQTAFENSLETVAPELTKRPDVRYKRIDPIYSEGVGWARHFNSIQVEDEELFYQVDSHMVFVQNWDRLLVNDWKKGRDKHNDDKIIITASCYSYDLDSHGRPSIYREYYPKTSKVKYFYYPPVGNVLGAHGDLIDKTSDIEPAIHICAGNFFTTTKWLKDVGINPKIFFDGEEQYMVLTSFAAGYKLYHPREIGCYHFIGTNQYVTKQWFEPIISMETYGDLVRRSVDQLENLIKNIDEDILEAFYTYSGVDYINRTLDERAKTYTIKHPSTIEETTPPTHIDIAHNVPSITPEERDERRSKIAAIKAEKPKEINKLK